MPGGGGGGGAEGAPFAGIGGGAGAAAGGQLSAESNVPGIGGAGGGDIGAPVLGVGGAGLDRLSTDFLSSIAESGLGGAIVPNSIDANCFALPPVGFSGPSSSSEDEAESTTDHSSSSGRVRDGRLPVGVEVKGGNDSDFATSCCCTRRWNGLVDSELASGDVTEGAVAVDSGGWLILLK